MSFAPDTPYHGIDTEECVDCNGEWGCRCKELRRQLREYRTWCTCASRADATTRTAQFVAARAVVALAKDYLDEGIHADSKKLQSAINVYESLVDEEK